MENKKSNFMSKKMKNSYLINIIALLLLFAVLQVIVGTGAISRYYISIIILICINIIMATSLNLSTGFLGQLVLGHAGFMAIGAYTAAAIGKVLVAAGNIPDVGIAIIAIIVGGLFAAISGVIIGIPALRLRGDYLAIMTLAFAEIVRIAINNFSYVGGAQGFTGIPNFTDFKFAYFVMLICVAFLVLLVRSRHGRAIISIKENEIAAEAVGINTTYYKVIGFAISALIAGIGGGVFAFHMSFLQPQMFGFMKSVDILVIVVLGGMGSMTGSIIAAIVFTFLPEMLRDFNEYRMVAYAVLLIVMMIVRPQGIFGTHEMSFSKSVKRRYLKWSKKGDTQLQEGDED